jgi:hypothetical protein
MTGVWTKFGRRPSPSVQNFAYINWGMACGQILSKLQGLSEIHITLKLLDNSLVGDILYLDNVLPQPSPSVQNFAYINWGMACGQILSKLQNMITLANNSSISWTADLKSIFQAADEANVSKKKIKQNRETYERTAGVWLGKSFDQMPPWAQEHIQLTNQLKDKILKFQLLRKRQIPEKILNTLNKCLEISSLLKNKKIFIPVQYKLKGYVDPFNLLRVEPSSSQTEPLQNFEFEWHLNLGLLMNIYKNTQDAELKKKLSFLALNYLAKAASIYNLENLSLFNPNLTQDLSNKIKNLLQISPFQPAYYHRENCVYETYIDDHLKQIYARASDSVFYLTVSPHFEHLLPLKFTVVQAAKMKEISDLVPQWTEILKRHFLNYLEETPASTLGLDFINPPLLFDLTDLLDRSVQTFNNAEKNKLFEEQMEQINDALGQSIEEALQKTRSQKPLFADDDSWLRFKSFLEVNVNAICRTQLGGVGILQILPIRENPNFYTCPVLRGDSKSFAAHLLNSKKMKFKEILETFVNLAGIRIGGVEGRAQIFNFLSLESFIQKMGKGEKTGLEYAVEGKNTMYFKDRFEIIKKNLFTRFKAKASKDTGFIGILGRPTLQLIEGLFREVDNETWDRLNGRSEMRQLIQTSCYRLMQHLAKAENHSANFTIFSQEIELVHCELSTLLSIFTPFKSSQFEEIYKQELHFIPEDLKGCMRVCLHATAMATFSALNHVLIASFPNAERVYGADIYYEEQEILGKKRSLNTILLDKGVKNVGLYVGEFNHNAVVDVDFQEYKVGDLIGDLHALLSAKPETKHLTVAVDSTIDFINSIKAKDLLAHYTNEIKEGKLNFVFFRSGVKFDMFGMDNYYGAPFYQINNGAAHWQPFDELFKNSIYQADTLSLQWFCLANKYASKSLDEYRAALFENTKEIMANVPEILRAGNNPEVKICTAADNVDSCFIHIKPKDRSTPIVMNGTTYTIPDFFYIACAISDIILKKFTDNHARILKRDSFGFYHANINFISNKQIRLFPSINKEENTLIIEALVEIAELCKQNTIADWKKQARGE